MPIDIHPLDTLPFFSSLQPDTRLAISRRAFTRQVPSGQTLVIEGMPAESCYFILAGEVRVLRMNAEGRMQVLARFSTGDALNVISLLTPEQVNRATIETLTPVSVLVMSASDFNEILNRYPDFAKTLLVRFATRLSKITDLAADLSLYAVRARLARFLIELADLTPSTAGWTQDEIAAHIGTVRDVVGRLLRDFEGAGLIQRQQGRIILLDREKLLEAAEDRQP